MPHATDVVIIGGGLVGASLALALEPLELSIDVLESIPFNHNAQPSFVLVGYSKQSVSGQTLHLTHARFTAFMSRIKAISGVRTWIAA